MFGSRDYSMRVWLDPDRLQCALGLTATDITSALQAQNIQVASGMLGQPPTARPGAFSRSRCRTLGRLADPSEFGFDRGEGSQPPAPWCASATVAKMELDALDYSTNSPTSITIRAVALAIFQRPGCECAPTPPAGSRST